MSNRQKRGSFAFLLLILLLIATIFALTFFLTAFIYQRINWQPSLFVTQMINSLLGLFFSVLTMGFIGYLFRSRQWAMQMGVFIPIFEAMQKIAKGDFSVRLDAPAHDNDLVSELTKNVNYMALELHQIETMRQEFISNVSHELQSPLTSIRGFAQALQNEHLNTEAKSHYLAIIETESIRLSRLTENLLRLASLEAEHVRFEPKPYALDKQLRNLILTCEPQWAGKAIDMDVSLEEIELTADQDLMTQVWMNLIHNSIKFTPDGGRIGVALCRRDNAAEFKIEDTGIGISEEDQTRIFERFYKADKSRMRSDSGGSGLGLSIVQKIIEMHKGTITVNSKPGVGTAFTIILPV